VSTYRLDVPALYRRLDERRQQLGLMWKDLAAHTGIPPSTFSRMADGKRPDADGLVTILVWLDLDTDIVHFIKPKDTP
jgi:transcriptional regulator with XRE-family HTH domain